MRISITFSAFLAYAGLISAQECATQPNSDNPTADILAVYTPGLNQIVPAGVPFTITWEPSLAINTVSIVLLQGPSTNVVPIGCIVDNTPNNGKFVWTPSTALVPDGDHNYGLKIIADPTGEFQYSTQFGISNPLLSSSSVPMVPVSISSSSAPVPASQLSDGQVQVPTGTAITTKKHYTATTYHTIPQYTVSASSSASEVATSKSSKPYSTYTHSSAIVFPSSGLPSKSANATHLSSHLSSHKHKSTKLPSIVASTGLPVNSTQIISPTGSMTVPSSLLPITQTAIASASAVPSVVAPSVSPTTTKSVLTAPTGAAQKMVAGGMLAGLGAVAALIL